MVITESGAILRYSGSDARIYLPYVTASTTDFATDTADHEGASGADVETDLNQYDLVYNSFEESYFVYTGAATTDTWQIPDGESDDWRAAKLAATVPAVKTRYVSQGAYTDLDLSGIVNYGASSQFNQESLAADLITPIYPDLVADDLVLATSGVLWEYSGSGLTNPNLESQSYAGSDWTEQTVHDLETIGTRTVAQNDVVVTTGNVLYQYGNGRANLKELPTETYNSGNGWTSVTPDHDIGASTGSDSVAAHEIIEVYAADGTVTFIVPERRRHCR